MKKITIGILIMLVIAVAALLLQGEDEYSAERKSLDLSTYNTDISPAKSNQPLTTSSITLAAVGDILIHDRVYEKAVEGNSYNFNPMLSKVQKQLQDADITFANQETVIGGTSIGLSSYPSFNSPTEVGDALKSSGVDIVSMANNHTLDRGEKAIQNAIKHWNKIGILYTGSYLSEKDRKEIRTIEQNGISVAFLAYTYGTNGIRPPSGKPYLVNYIDRELIKNDILAAKKEADAVVVSIHFGNEYERYPSNDQLALSSDIAEAGADLILGHHPHVLQPLEWIETSDDRKVLVAYSLGNFLSGQRMDYKDIGGILKVNIVKKEFRGISTITVTSPSFTPTFVDKNYHVNPLSEVNSELLNEINQHMKQWIPDLKVPKA
ncbi:CapA family protein [Guptibacillus hwajinpoensis]|uniref:Capsular biosynthesis protein n=1 Tax=Guptibacillus hwajinpoensis TaxID=208199 RepID=A0A0J6CVS7_9BACL|nr:CapA family protein [Alkalihalobacillus macyae]KMM37280.1 capsular biosynthesis protein [Alkalihalobacillus macyae]